MIAKGWITDEGYKEFWDTKRSQYRFEHQIVMEKHLGRRLTKNERIHHIDNNKLNNKISNLLLMSIRDHALLHSKLYDYLVQTGKLNLVLEYIDWFLKGQKHD